MGQGDIIDFLEQVNKPISRKEIADGLNLSVTAVSHTLSRLIKSDSLKIIEINREQAMRLYRCKRRMRLYYV